MEIYLFFRGFMIEVTATCLDFYNFTRWVLEICNSFFVILGLGFDVSFDWYDFMSWGIFLR